MTDKTGLIDFGRGLVAKGFEIVSTGGTARHLMGAGIPIVGVEEVTGFPEMLDGRVKTLHPLIHGGLLGDTASSDHVRQMASAGIEPISVAAVNLYAFEQTVRGPHTLAEAVESIDIGGPAMIRAAAKNHGCVAVVVDPADYPLVLEALDDPLALAEQRITLAAKAFRHTAYYDSMIARYLGQACGSDPLAAETLTVGLRKRQVFRYGENPHQHAGLYRDPLSVGGVANAEQLWGKELSYNNLLDADAAWELVCDLPPGSCAIIKHGNPCGAAHGERGADSYRLARESDPISAFGGIAAFNGPIDESTAMAMAEKGNFLEVIIATEFNSEALAVFANRAGWGQDVRLLQTNLSDGAGVIALRSVRGGALVQTSDEEPEGTEWIVPTSREPDPSEWEAARFLWRIVPHVKSNAIVIGSGHRLLGVGAGQMNRVQSVRLALEQAGDGARGAALASDAFFPFPDSIETAAAAGIKTIIQPGGSKKDADVISAANAHEIAMILTGVRHFRH